MLCGTGAQIAWVQEADYRPVGDGTMGPITRQIRELYFRAVKGELAQYAHWVQPVYGAAAGNAHLAQETSLT